MVSRSPFTTPWLLAFLFFALHCLCPVITTLAKPIPLPLPLLMADYLYSPFPGNRSRAYISRRGVGLAYTPWSSYNTSSVPGYNLSRRDSFSGLLSSVNAMGGNADTLQQLASQADSTDSTDYDYQRNCAAALTSFSQNLGTFQTDFQTASAPHPPGKGLANYDPNIPLEVAIKDVVNAIKSTLSSVTEIVEKLPVLGPILGPIVFQIKCIVDDLLNKLEEGTDKTIGALSDLIPILG